MIGNILLIGYMGTGKTSVSTRLNKMLNFDVVDTDVMIMEKENQKISDIFEQKGEEYFRKLETTVLKELQDRQNLIISCGGGIVLREENVIQMKQLGKVVLLTATPETIYYRVKDNKDRPLLNNNMTIDYITQMLENRKEKYLQAADVIVETDKKSLKQIAKEIIGILEEKEL